MSEIDEWASFAYEDYGTDDFFNSVDKDVEDFVINSFKIVAFTSRHGSIHHHYDEIMFICNRLNIDDLDRSLKFINYFLHTFGLDFNTFTDASMNSIKLLIQFLTDADSEKRLFHNTSFLERHIKEKPKYRLIQDFLFDAISNVMDIAQDTLSKSILHSYNTGNIILAETIIRYMNEHKINKFYDENTLKILYNIEMTESNVEFFVNILLWLIENDRTSEYQKFLNKEISYDMKIRFYHKLLSTFESKNMYQFSDYYKNVLRNFNVVYQLGPSSLTYIWESKNKELLELYFKGNCFHSLNFYPEKRYQGFNVSSLGKSENSLEFLLYSQYKPNTCRNTNFAIDMLIRAFNNKQSQILKSIVNVLSESNTEILFIVNRKLYDFLWILLFNNVVNLSQLNSWILKPSLSNYFREIYSLIEKYKLYLRNIFKQHQLSYDTLTVITGFL